MAAAGLNAAHGGPMAPACARVPGPASMSASTPRRPPAVPFATPLEEPLPYVSSSAPRAAVRRLR